VKNLVIGYVSMKRNHFSGVLISGWRT